MHRSLGYFYDLAEAARASSHGLQARRLATLLLGVAGLLVATASAAEAQRGGPDLRLGAGALVDFAGGVEYDLPGPGPDPDDSPRATPGLRLHMDYDVHRYVSVGGLVRLSFWRADDDYYFDAISDGRNMLVDLAFRVNGHYDWRDFRFYGALTLGPTISRLNRDGDDIIDNPGVGVAAGITPGAEWWFARNVGLYLEMFGWSGHFFRHDLDRSGSMHVRLNQVTWQFGFVFAL